MYSMHMELCKMASPGLLLWNSKVSFLHLFPPVHLTPWYSPSDRSTTGAEREWHLLSSQKDNVPQEVKPFLVFVHSLLGTQTCDQLYAVLAKPSEPAASAQCLLKNVGPTSVFMLPYSFYFLSFPLSPLPIWRTSPVQQSFKMVMISKLGWLMLFHREFLGS